MSEHEHEHEAECPQGCTGVTKPTSEESMEAADRKYPGPREFTHLHVHTLFSTLDGVASPADYVGRAKEFGMEAIAITDHGSLGGIPDMYFETKKAGIKLITGIEAYFNDHHMDWVRLRDSGVKMAEIREAMYKPEGHEGLLAMGVFEDAQGRVLDSPVNRITRNRHLIILAKNQVGFKNLLHITSNSWKIGYYRKPRIWLEAMSPRKEGLIVLSGCLNGPIAHELALASQALSMGQAERAYIYIDRAEHWVRTLKDEFGDNFYFELQMPGPDITEGYDVLRLSIALAKKYGVRTALTADSHYLQRSDWETQRALMAVAQKMTIHDPNLFIADTCEGYLKSRAELRQTFYEFGYDKYATIQDIETACDGTTEIQERCDNFTPDLSPKLPEIEDADQKLAVIAAKALMDKGLHTSTKKYPVDGNMVTHVEQVSIEMERIRTKGFSSYFLITKDLVDYSRSNGWLVGPGRGSAPGSAICYLLGITTLDPLKWGLSFNRFLDPSRGGYMLKCTMD